MIQGEGDLPVVVPPSSSSSSVKPSSSSSSVNPSSSSSISSSSVTSSSSDGTDLLPIDMDVVHNFTEEATASDYFEFMGSLSTSKGTVDYEGETLSRCLKMESSTNVEFTLAKAAKVTLVLNNEFAGTIKVDGKAASAVNGIVSVELVAGHHAITKGDVANLYLIIVKMESDSEEDSDGTQSIGAVTFGENPLRYLTHESRLEVFAQNIRRVDVLRLDGRQVKVFASVDTHVSYDLSHLQPGVYLVRVVADGNVFQQKIFKK